MAKSSIEWTDETWNPVTGCTRASAGCDNCYAVKMTKRLEAMGNDKYRGLVNVGKTHFNGVVKCHEDALTLPFSWKKPRMCFVNSMSDLFHRDVPFHFIDKVFAIMALTPEHTYQILTKRPDRMAEYLSMGRAGLRSRWANVANPNARPPLPPAGGYGREAWVRLNYDGTSIGASAGPMPWPLPNVWIGTSVENQQTADERIPHLLQIPAAVRFLSCEPLLGPVDLTKYLYADCDWCDGCGYSTGGTLDPQDEEDCANCEGSGTGDEPLSEIHWVIAGGESGPNARPMDVSWLYRLKEQCEAANVPIFIKQLGKSFYHSGYRDGEDIITAGPKGADWDHINFPDDLKVREFPEATRG